MLALSGTVSVAFEWRRPNPPGRNAKLRLPQRSDPAAIHGRRHKQGRIPVPARDTSGPLTFGPANRDRALPMPESGESRARDPADGAGDCEDGTGLGIRPPLTVKADCHSWATALAFRAPVPARAADGSLTLGSPDLA